MEDQQAFPFRKIGKWAPAIILGCGLFYWSNGWLSIFALAIAILLLYLRRRSSRNFLPHPPADRIKAAGRMRRSTFGLWTLLIVSVFYAPSEFLLKVTWLFFILTPVPGQFIIVLTSWIVGIGLFVFFFFLLLGGVYAITTLSLTRKRLHDLDWSEEPAWLLFIPVVNLILIGYLLLARGSVGPNRFGLDPRGIPVETPGVLPGAASVPEQAAQALPAPPSATTSRPADE